jgi:predicted Fe-Mo cluster-binding NifX family protein
MIRVAIPTDDGLMVSQDFLGSRAFIVATVKAGLIVHQDLRWNMLSEILTSEHGCFYNIVDCTVIIVNEIGNCNREFLKSLRKKIVHTDQTLINKAFAEYLDIVSVGNEAVQTAGLSNPVH